MSASALPELDRLRAALALARRQAKRYPAELRAAVLAFVDCRGAEGQPPSTTALALGISPTTISNWRAQRPAPCPTPFLPVVVRQDVAARAGLRLVLPGGVWLDGLSLDDVVALCERLHP